MPATFIGIRHHSPACAGLVRDTIRNLRPAHVLIEGPADMNDRIDELLLGHELPIAIFTSYRDEQHQQASWSPFCEHSPEWVGLTEGRRAGATVRFIDLPAWHRALADRANRFADAEQRYDQAVSRLCEIFKVDNIDTLWDHLFEIEPDTQLAERLAAYFDLVRGDSAASDQDSERESYMSQWVSAAISDAGERDVVVITGGFHRPALTNAPPGQAAWPEIPAMPAGAVGGSYLVPFSFKRLDAFDGYQSGMPSPHYYQQLWTNGLEAAGDDILATVTARLRRRKQPVSTADLIAARTLSLGLARLRGHRAPSRVDVLDGLTSALISNSLDQAPPWTRRGQLAAGADPVIVEMVAAISGDTVGRLHQDTPLPPLVHDVEAELLQHKIPATGSLTLDLAHPAGLAQSRVLHRLRSLKIPGNTRKSGPRAGGGPVLSETWKLTTSDLRLPALIEAGSFGATLAAASGAALADRFTAAGSDADAVSGVLFEAALCGLDELSDRVLDELGRLIGTVNDVGALGSLLTTALGLWRHDRLLGAAGSPALAVVVDSATTRAIWLIEGLRGGPAPADSRRLQAVSGVRDAIVHADAVLTVDREAVVGVFARAAAPNRPADLRGAAVGFILAVDTGTDETDLALAVRRCGSPTVLGDFLAGLFALAREHLAVEGPHDIIRPLDEILAGYGEDDFLVALPSLRLAFSWLPPRELEAFAQRLLDRRGVRASGRQLLKLSADPAILTRARNLESRVEDIMVREALLSAAVADG